MQKGRSRSGPIANVNEKPGLEGKAMKNTGFVLGLCLTDHPENRFPSGKPSNYD